MREIRTKKDIASLHNPVVTLGVFDGFHKGHQRIMRTVIKRARAIDGESLVVTFFPHPAEVLKKRPPAPLTDPTQKMDLIASSGVDACIIFLFNTSFACMSPKEFVAEILVEKIGAKEIVVGEGYRFGKGEAGTIAALKRLGKVHNFKVRETKALRIGGEIVSSTRIRALIKKGNLTRASFLLGKPFSIRGHVINGSLRGRKIGYPTANIAPGHEFLPPYGVYAILVKPLPLLAGKKISGWSIPADETTGKIFQGILNIGTRPTFKKGKLTIEAHLFGFAGDLYGRELEIAFIKRLRAEKKFVSLTSLKQALDVDSKKAKQILRRRKKD